MLWWRGQAAALRDSGKCHAHQEGLDAMRASALEICSNEKGFLKSTAMQDTIALVDDDRNILTSFSTAPEAEGFKVRTYNDGAEALRGISASPVDLAVLDIRSAGRRAGKGCVRMCRSRRW